ncbi:MAG: amino acid carrier protein [Bacteroidales bacterium]|nr:amino acid carrier protein [Bacteroidales bacterium]
MRSFLFNLLFIFISVLSFGQNFEFEIKTSNKSKKINNGVASIIVKGGTAPYTYYWSNQSTSLNSLIADGLTEGKEYSIEITDAKGIKAKKTFVIETTSADEKINSFFTPIVDAIATVLMFDIFATLHIYNPILHDDSGNVLKHANGDPKKMKIPFVVVWLVFGALFFTIKMKFINFKGFKHAIDLIRGKYDNPKDKGEVSHFQALTTALSATVGLGNIAGVAIAITIGGPGATFWMILAGLLGMASKFTEVTLGVKYRTIDEDGQVAGGPMYYLSKALKKKNLGKLGKVLAAIFAVLVIGGSLGGGNMFQANQAFSQLSGKLSPYFMGIEGYGAYFGILIAIFVGIVVIGGIKSIANVTEKIVPFMAVLYVGAALIIIGINITETGHAFGLIFNGAFAADAMKGGFVGVLIVGFQRAAFSNEAGVGSASIAHSAVKTDRPVSEGFVALLEPFIDTVVICTMTALVIIFTGFYDPTLANGLAGVELTSKAFESVFPWFSWILLIAVLLFAFSTMISWSYYGLNGFKYLFGKWFGNKKVTKNLYLSSLVYYIIFLIFIVIGSASSLGAVVDFSDFMILSMAIPNILGLLILAPEVKQDLKKYLSDIKNGVIKKYK